MFMLPLAPLVIWLVNLITLALAGFGFYFVIGWLSGIVVGTGFLIAGAIMILLTFTGRYIVLLFLGRRGSDEPKPARIGEIHTVRRPDGTELHVELYGPAEAQPLVLTHGIASDSTDWYYAKRHLSERFRLVLWDVTGLGKSSRSPHNDYSLEKMAGDLEAVLGLVNRPAILVGHSMGGMITLTFCRLFPQHLGRKVAGLVLVNTTYTDPVKTTTGRGWLTPLQKPVLTPLLYLIIGLWPLMWLLNWLSYFNGTSHIPTRIFTFAGHQTRGQLNYMAVLGAMSHPSVLARQMLAMFHYDATETLGRINVPTLIITADKDRGCIPEASQYMHQQIQGSQLFVAEPCGHVSIAEQYGQVMGATGRFGEQVAANRKTGAA